MDTGFKQAIATQAVTGGRMKLLRDQARKVHRLMVEALRNGDMTTLGTLLSEKNILGNLASPGIDRSHFERVIADVQDLIDGASYIGAGGGGYYIFMAREGAREELIERLNQQGSVNEWTLNNQGTVTVVDHAGLASLQTRDVGTHARKWPFRDPDWR